MADEVNILGPISILATVFAVAALPLLALMLLAKANHTRAARIVVGLLVVVGFILLLTSAFSALWANPETVIVVVKCLLAWLLVSIMSQLAMAGIGSALSERIANLTFGFGPRLIEGRLPGIPSVSVRLFLVGGHVKFENLRPVNSLLVVVGTSAMFLALSAILVGLTTAFNIALAVLSGLFSGLLSFSFQVQASQMFEAMSGQPFSVILAYISAGMAVAKVLPIIGVNSPSLVWSIYTLLLRKRPPAKFMRLFSLFNTLGIMLLLALFVLALLR